MIRIRYALDRQYTGIIIADDGDFIRVQWDDGRCMHHHRSEVEIEPNRTTEQSD